MPVPAIRAFLEGPYGVIDDVKMLNFFRFLGLSGGIVMLTLAVASIFIQNFWCRYLCPYGALMGAVATASPLAIRRDAAVCIDCAKCARACPAALPVDRLVTIRSAECTACLECVAACPASGALYLSADVGQTIVMRRLPTVTPNSAKPSKRVPSWAIAAGIALIFLQRVFLRPRDRPLEHGPPRPRLLRPDSPRQRIPAPITQRRRTALRAVMPGFRPACGGAARRCADVSFRSPAFSQIPRNRFQFHAFHPEG